jgi:hypothetical protein
LLRSMECSARLEILPFLAPVMVEKTTPPPTKVTGKFQKKYLYIRAHKLIMHSVPTLSKLRSGTSCQTISTGTTLLCASYANSDDGDKSQYSVDLLVDLNGSLVGRLT